MSKKMNASEYACCEIVSEMPAVFPSGRGEPFPDELIGAQVVAIGTLSDREAVEGGGLVIDYRRSASDAVRRLILGNNETGMWVEYHGARSGPTPRLPTSVRLQR